MQGGRVGLKTVTVFVPSRHKLASGNLSRRNKIMGNCAISKSCVGYQRVILISVILII